MSYLADTGILLRFIHPADPQHPCVRDAVHTLLQREEMICYTQQNRREFWNVCTRPVERNGLGLTIEETVFRLQRIDELFVRLPERAGAGLEWDRLVTTYAVRGVQVHDAQLVGEMLVHAIDSLLTLNPDDFRRFQEIRVVHPNDVRDQV